MSPVVFVVGELKTYELLINPRIVHL